MRGWRGRAGRFGTYARGRPGKRRRGSRRRRSRRAHDGSEGTRDHPTAHAGATARLPKERDELPRHPHRVVVGHQEPGRRQGAQLGVGQEVERLVGADHGVGGVLVGPQQQDRAGRCGDRRRSAGAGGRRASGGRTWPRRGRGCRCRRRRRRRGGRDRGRPDCPAPTAARRPKAGTRACAAAQRAIEAGQRGGAAGDAPGGALAGELVAPVQPVGGQREPRGLEPPRSRRPAARSRLRCRARRAAVACPPPRGRSRRSTSANQSGVYGWRGRSSESPCSGKVGQHDAKARGQPTRRPAPTPDVKARVNAAEQVLDLCPSRGTLCGRRRGGDRA